MLVLMLLALSRARVTNGGAHAAKVGHKAGVTTDEGSAIPTDIRAIDAKLRTFHHLADTYCCTIRTLRHIAHKLPCRIDIDEPLENPPFC